MKVKYGTHYRAITSELSPQRTAEALSVLSSPEILAVLERNPIARIIIDRTGSKFLSGEYDRRD